MVYNSGAQVLQKCIGFASDFIIKMPIIYFPS